MPIRHSNAAVEARGANRCESFKEELRKSKEDDLDQSLVSYSPSLPLCPHMLEPRTRCSLTPTLQLRELNHRNLPRLQSAAYMASERPQAVCNNGRPTSGHKRLSAVERSAFMFLHLLMTCSSQESNPMSAVHVRALRRRG